MLTTQQVCDLCEIPFANLTEWVNKGFVTPAMPGGKGRGNSHMFSARQVLALAIVGAMHQSERGCSLKFIRRTLRMFEGMSSEALKGWLSHEDWDDESFDDRWLKKDLPRHPVHDLVEEEVWRRLSKVEPTVRAMLEEEKESEATPAVRNEYSFNDDGSVTEVDQNDQPAPPVDAERQLPGVGQRMGKGKASKRKI